MQLVAPHAGANKKINKLFTETQGFANVIKCDKVRDTKTGALSGFEVFADDLGGKPCMIVDDICDGGRTFIGVAEALKQKNAGDIYLFVTHGIFSQGLDGLSQVFKRIFTTNSIKEIEHPSVMQIKIQL